MVWREARFGHVGDRSTTADQTPLAAKAQAPAIPPGPATIHAQLVALGKKGKLTLVNFDRHDTGVVASLEASQNVIAIMVECRSSAAYRRVVHDEWAIGLRIVSRHIVVGGREMV